MTELRAAPLLFLDCQATAPHSSSGNLVELAWRVRVGVYSSDIFSALVQLPQEVALPAPVRRLTGLSETDLTHGLTIHQLRDQLLKAIQTFEPKRVIIHYASFEQPYLQALLGVECPPLCCTHKMARRLLTGLPSLSIASLAGYFGAPLEKRNRSRFHVAATEAIYDGLVPCLEAQGIERFADLDTFLDKPAPKRGSGQPLFLLPRSRRLALSDRPGVYHFADSRGRLLYVGKASSLKTRVNSYFRGRRCLSAHQRELLTQVASIDTIICPTPVHAALLECSHIQTHDPPYNRSLKPAGRRLIFCNRSLQTLAFRWSPVFSVGPFPNSRRLQQLHSLFALLMGYDNDGLLFEHALSSVELEGGLACFHHRFNLPTPLTRRDLLALGLWLLKRGESEPVQGGEQAEGKTANSVDPVRMISNRCQRVLVQVARHYRRAQILTRLLDTEVRWQEADQHHSIRLQNYAPHPSQPNTWAELGVATYDMARTLLTEIHRLQAAGVPVDVRPLTPAKATRDGILYAAKPCG